MRARLHAAENRRRKQTQRDRWSESVILMSTALSLAVLRFGELQWRWMVLIRLNIFSYRGLFWVSHIWAYLMWLTFNLRSVHFVKDVRSGMSGWWLSSDSEQTHFTVMGDTLSRQGWWYNLPRIQSCMLFSGGGICIESHCLFTLCLVTPCQQLHQLSPWRNVGPLC